MGGGDGNEVCLIVVVFYCIVWKVFVVLFMYYFNYFEWGFVFVVVVVDLVSVLVILILFCVEVLFFKKDNWCEIIYEWVMFELEMSLSNMVKLCGRMKLK